MNNILDVYENLADSIEEKKILEFMILYII